MAKRYYQSDKDNVNNEPLRRRMEMEQDGMIYEDRSAVANLPQDVKMKPYPPYGGYMPEELDDTIRRVDDMMDESDDKIRDYMKPRKA